MNSELTLYESKNKNSKKVLFLGYSTEQTSLISELSKSGCQVWHTQNRIESTTGFDLVVSFGYRYIIGKKVIESSAAPIINLHISYLPWNRGAHPNFWCFYDGTPCGVSIHLIDEGIDTGPIIYQKLVSFNKSESTFTKTYKRLISEIESLFVHNIRNLIQLNFTTRVQKGNGSCHSISELPKEFKGWDSDISIEIARLKELK